MHSAIVIASILVSLQFLGGHGGTPNPRLNFFDIDLLRLTAEGQKGNVMLSPASIKSSLAMLLEGAEGATAAEIKSALRVSPEKDDFRQELVVYLKALETNSSSVSLNSANAVFLSNKLKLKKEYEMVVQRMYNSLVTKLDFQDSKTSADKINGWVKEKTKGFIPTVVEQAQIPPATEMLLANALYFKAPWKTSFDAKSTHSDCFYTEGVCKNVAMMDIQACLKYAYVDELRAHAIELPYTDDRYAMLLLMPQDRNGAEGLIRDLPYYSLPQITGIMYTTDVILTMPKFNVDYNHNMVETLKKLEINSLFTKSANLSGIFESGESPFLDSMYHSVHMTVDEQGTIAAAATVSFVVPLINNKVELRVDRPFLFFIRDIKLGVVLFEGKIDEPMAFDENAKAQPQIPQEPVKNPQQLPTQPFSQPANQPTKPKQEPAQPGTLSYDKIQPNNDPDFLNQYDLNRPKVNETTANNSTQKQPTANNTSQTNSQRSRPNLHKKGTAHLPSYSSSYHQPPLAPYPDYSEYHHDHPYSSHDRYTPYHRHPDSTRPFYPIPDDTTQNSTPLHSAQSGYKNLKGKDGTIFRKLFLEYVNL